MNMKDLANNFQKIVICKLNHGYHYEACPVEKFKGLLSEDRENTDYVSLRVDERTHVYISINQKDKSNFEAKINYRPSGVRIMLFKMNENDEVVGYVGGNSGISRDVHFESVLEAGSYLISSEIEWENSLPQDYVISAYGDKFVDLVKMEREENHSKLVENVAKWYVKQH